MLIVGLIMLVYSTLPKAKIMLAYLTYYEVVMFVVSVLDETLISWWWGWLSSFVAYDFPNDDELHFGIEMLDFFKAKARMSTFNSLSWEWFMIFIFRIMTFWTLLPARWTRGFHHFMELLLAISIPFIGIYLRS